MMAESDRTKLKRVWIVGCCWLIWAILVSSQLAAQPVVASDAPTATSTNGEVPAQPPTTPDAVSWFFHTIGLIGYFIIGLSMYFVALVVRMFLEIRANLAMPAELVQECESLLQQRQFKEVYHTVQEDPSLFSRLLTVGISELPSGLSEARDALDRKGEALRGELERKINPMAVLGTLGPMIGLVGTLKGMIASFGSIAMSGNQLRAEKVAEGISEALLLTLLGVGLSVPAIYFHALFRNRIVGITSETTMAADDFLRHFSHAARAAKSAAANPPANPS